MTDKVIMQSKFRPTRLDYDVYNFCSTCNQKYLKDVFRCFDCKRKVRTKPWHKTMVVDMKRF